MDLSKLNRNDNFHVLAQSPLSVQILASCCMTLIKIPVYDCCMWFKQEIVPTLCFYNVARGKEKCGRDGSYYNDEEVQESCFIIFHLAEIVICVSLLSPCSFSECCWWTPKIVRCFLVCPRLSNILSSSLFESACSFFNCFFILWLAFFVFFLFSFPWVFHSSFYISFDLWMFI